MISFLALQADVVESSIKEKEHMLTSEKFDDDLSLVQALLLKQVGDWYSSLVGKRILDLLSRPNTMSRNIEHCLLCIESSKVFFSYSAKKLFFNANMQFCMLFCNVDYFHNP